MTDDLSHRGGYDVEQLKSIAKVQVRRNAFICRRLSVTLSNNSSPPSFTLLDSICLKSLLLIGPILENRGILYLILLLNQYIPRCDLKDSAYNDVKCKHFTAMMSLGLRCMRMLQIYSSTLYGQMRHVALRKLLRNEGTYISIT